jgi:hypothetical protein
MADGAGAGALGAADGGATAGGLVTVATTVADGAGAGAAYECDALGAGSTIGALAIELVTVMGCPERIAASPLKLLFAMSRKATCVSAMVRW